MPGLKHIAKATLITGLLSAGAVLLLFVPAVQAQDVHDSGCLMCHGNPNFVGVTGNGETVSLYVDHTNYDGSIHAGAGLQCVACHADQKSYPHNEEQVFCNDCHTDTDTLTDPDLEVTLKYANARSLTIKAGEACKACHAEQYENAADSAHQQVLESGNRDAPVCVDCHGSHEIESTNLNSRTLVADTCGECHRSVYSTYRTSIHGTALAGNPNPDVPTCVECHGVHEVHGPRDPQFRDESIAICGGCHADPERMDKYGISTDVFETYLDDFHGRTVEFLRRNDVSRPSDKATCYDCHGIHNIRSGSDPLSTVYPDNLQETCQQCHEDANITFPDAWLAHEVASWEETPILFGVNTAYRYMIPTLMIGFMGYIALDARKRLVDRRKHHQKNDFIDFDRDF